MIRFPILRPSLLIVGALMVSSIRLEAQTAAGAKRTARDGVYTAAQADRGQTTFGTTCASCHAPRDFTGAFFLKKWPTVGGLYNHVQTMMPEDAPGSLSDKQYSELIAYILRLNSMPAGQRELPVDLAVLEAITIPPPPR